MVSEIERCALCKYHPKFIGVYVFPTSIGQAFVCSNDKCAMQKYIIPLDLVSWNEWNKAVIDTRELEKKKVANG